MAASPEHTGATATETVATSESHAAPGLTVVHHPQAEHLGHGVVLRPGARIVVGRHEAGFGDEVFAHASVSRRHAVFAAGEDGSLFVEDLGSHNGTFVNGARVDRTTLRMGDAIRVGRVLVYLHDDVLLPAQRVAPLPGFAGFSATWARLSRVASGLAPRHTTAMLWGPTGSGRRSLAAAIGEPGPVHVLLDPPERWPEHGTAVLVEPQHWSSEARARWLASDAPAGARRILVTTRDPSALVTAGVSRETIERLAPSTLHVPELGRRAVDIAAIVWDLCPRFAGPDAQPTVALVERLLRARTARDAERLAALVERATWESDGPEVDVFRDLDTLDAEDSAPAVPSLAATLTVSRDAAWFTCGAEVRGDLSGRRLLQRLTRALVEARLDRPGRALPVDALFAAGWPDDRTSGRARVNRVYVALTKLRKAGLRGVLQRTDRGYLLDPDVPVEWAPE